MHITHLHRGLFVVLLSLILGGCNLNLSLNKRPSGIKINTIPSAAVYLDNQLVGQTPYENNNITAGSHILKLVPEASSSATTPDNWETKLTLYENTTATINRTFHSSLSEVEASFLQLQPEPGTNNSYLSVITDPDNVNLTIDGQSSGFTPVSKKIIAPGPHTLTLSSPGYKSQTLSLNTSPKHNLLVNVKLASDPYFYSPDLTTTAPGATPSAQVQLPAISPSPKPSLIPSPTATAAAVLPPYAIVSDTPDTQALGGLNVRQEPTSSGAIIGLAPIGEKLPFIETNAAGWHQVTFRGQAGWVSGKYTSLVK